MVAIHAIIVMAAMNTPNVTWVAYVVILLGAALIMFVICCYPESYVSHSHRAPWDRNK